MELQTIALLRREWATRSSSLEGSKLLARLANAEPAIAAAQSTSLTELFARLDRRHEAAFAEPWCITEAIIRQLALSDLASIGILVALIPGMLRIAETFDWGAGDLWRDRDELMTDLVSVTWKVLADVGGTTVAFPERTILRRARQRLGRLRTGLRNARSREVLGLDQDLDDGLSRGPYTTEHRFTPGRKIDTVADPNPIPVLDALAMALDHLVDDLIPRADARLVFGHRVLGYSMRELAQFLGEKEDAIEYRAHRAEVLLCAS